MINKYLISMLLLSISILQTAFSEEIKIKLPETEIESTFKEHDFVGPLFTETSSGYSILDKTF